MGQPMPPGPPQRPQYPPQAPQPQAAAMHGQPQAAYPQQQAPQYAQQPPQYAQPPQHAHPPAGQMSGGQAFAGPRPPSGLLAAPNRWIVGAVSLLVGVASVAFFTLVLSGRAAELVLDYPSRHFLYPFTIQNVMHLMFFFAVGELFVRWRAGASEGYYTKLSLLPEDDNTVLQAQDLGAVRRRVAPLVKKRGAYLPNLVNLAILQFQSNRSVDQTTAVVNSSLELISHRVDLAYNLVRFLAWMVPTLGFIGTVYGLGASLAEAGDPSKPLDLQAVSRTLGVGFDTTMVALVESAILVFLIHVTQETEEAAVNDAGEYTLRNLINRLYSGPGAGR